MLARTAFFILCCLGSSFARASEDFSASRWYFYLSAGVGQPSYDSGTQGLIDSEKAAGRESPQAGFFDLPGIYRQVQPGLGLGAVLSFSFENYATKWRAPESFAIQSYNPAASVLYFTGGKMGLGLFGRFDLGASRIYQRRANLQGGSVPVIQESNQDGVFSQVALGYGWEASHFATVLVHVNAVLASAGSSRLRAATFNIGFLL